MTECWNNDSSSNAGETLPGWIKQKTSVLNHTRLFVDIGGDCTQRVIDGLGMSEGGREYV